MKDLFERTAGVSLIGIRASATAALATHLSLVLHGLSEELRWRLQIVGAKQNCMLDAPAARGSEMVMVSPPPGVSSGVIVPCMASARPRASVRPSPAPPDSGMPPGTAVPGGLPRRSNGANIWSRSAGEQVDQHAFQQGRVGYIDPVGNPQQGKLTQRGEVADPEVVRQRSVDLLLEAGAPVGHDLPGDGLQALGELRGQLPSAGRSPARPFRSWTIRTGAWVLLGQPGVPHGSCKGPMTGEFPDLYL